MAAGWVAVELVGFVTVELGSFIGYVDRDRGARVARMNGDRAGSVLGGVVDEHGEYLADSRGRCR